MRIARALIVIAVLGITFAAYFPSLKNGFVNWDDDYYVTRNTAIQRLSPGTVKEMFSSFFVGNYHPLTMLSYAVEYRFFKNHPFGYHLDNLILHLLNVLLAFWLIFRLTGGNAVVAAFSAALFGVHPLHVESVAWISERKDVLYALFFLGALISYRRYLRGGVRYYWLSLSLGTLSLLSKPMAVSLPAVLFLMDYLAKRKFGAGAMRDKIPFFIAAAVAAGVALFSQSDAMHGGIILGLMGNAGYALAFYIGKLVFPLGLSCFYPYPRMTDIFTPPVYCLAAVLLMFALAAVWFAWKKNARELVFGSAFFLLTLLPVLQLVPFGGTLCSDRYMYIPALGLFFLAAFYCARLFEKMRSGLVRGVLLATCVAVICNFAFMASERCKVWEDGFILWSDAISKSGGKPVAVPFYNRALLFIGFNQYEPAVRDLEKGLEQEYRWRGLPWAVPATRKSGTSGAEYRNILNDLAWRIADFSPDHAIVIFKTLVEKAPDEPRAYMNLCIAFGRKGEFKDAIAAGERAVALAPGMGGAQYNLAVAYSKNGQYELAQKHLRLAEQAGFRAP